MKQRKLRFEKLVQAYATDLHRFALWLTKDAHIAEDIIQEVYVRAWKNLDQLKDDNAAKPWLLTIVRNENARRFQRKQMETVDIDKTPLTADNSLTPEHQTELSLLRQAISELPESYREPLIMQVLHGMSCKEIADTMALAQNTVMTRLFRAKQKVKEALVKTDRQNVSRLFP